MVISETAWFSLSVILNGANGHLRFGVDCLPQAFLVQENQQQSLPPAHTPPTSHIC